MATPIQMPKLSDTMTEGTLLRWLVKEGQAVHAGDPIAEVETDKATLEMEAYQSGTVLKLLVADGATVPVGGALGVLGKPGESWEAAAASVAAAPAAAPAPARGEAGAGAAAAKEAVAPARAPATGPALRAAPPARPGWPPRAPPPEAAERVHYERRAVAGEIPGLTWGFGAGITPPVAPAPRTAGGRLRATPVARKLAAAQGVPLEALTGSGPGGRITRADVEEGASRGPGRRASAAAPPPGPARVVQLSQMRKAIGRAMAQANREIPHFYLTIDVDMGAVASLRAQAKVAQLPLSVNDLVLRAVALAALEVPLVQGQLVDEATLSIPGTCHLGFATALDDGLITPVIRDAQLLPVQELGRIVKELAGKAREKRLLPEDYQGATITVSNLGMYGVEHFYAIVNPPQASIVSVGKLREEPVVADGRLAVGHRMRLGYAGDHRIVDGAVGALFLQALERLLETPVRLLLQ